MKYNINNAYQELLDNTYVVDKKLVCQISTNVANNTLKVGNNPRSKLCYLYILHIDDFGFCCPITIADLEAQGKTFKQFEEDYSPKLFTQRCPKHIFDLTTASRRCENE